MISILEQPEISEQLSQLKCGEVLRLKGTEEDFWQLATSVDEYNFEYQGQEIMVSMSYESGLHSEIASKINFLLQLIFAERIGKIKIFNSNRPVCILDCNHAIFNPDGSVIDAAGKKYQYQPDMSAELSPIVLFEVLSPSTRIRDWGEKLPCYKKISTLQHIFFVEQEKISVTVFERLPESGKWLESIYENEQDTFEISGQMMKLSDIYKGTLILNKDEQ